MATLYEVWRLALPPATVLHTGSEGHIVRAVVTLRSTQPALPDIHGGELVLVSPALLEALDSRLAFANFIDRLHGANLAAIAMSGPIDAQALHAAQAINIALFEVPVATDLRVVQREIERLLADAEAQYERRAAQLYAALTRGGFDGGRATLLHTLAQWTGATPIFPAPTSLPTTVPVVVDGQWLGTLGDDGAHPWNRWALEQGAAALALLLDRERAIQATEERLRGDVSQMLLAGLPLDSAAVRRAAEQQIDLHAPYSLLALRPGTPDVTLERLQIAAQRALERLHLAGLVGEYEQTVFVALPTSTPSDDQQVHAVHSALIARGISVSGGYSIAAHTRDWPTTWLEAQTALQLGRRLFGAGVLAGGSELGVYQVLLGLSDDPHAAALYQQTIAPLAEHDKGHNSDLLHTLHMFFAHLGNHSQAAIALHVHRNTLLYRLGRITALTGYHLDRATDRLALQVGLALHRVFESKRSS